MSGGFFFFFFPFLNAGGEKTQRSFVDHEHLECTLSGTYIQTDGKCRGLGEMLSGEEDCWFGESGFWRPPVSACSVEHLPLQFLNA